MSNFEMKLHNAFHTQCEKVAEAKKVCDELGFVYYTKSKWRTPDSTTTDYKSWLRTFKKRGTTAGVVLTF